MNIEIVRGSAAAALLSDDSFVAQWADLVARCPWATGFQHPEFARAWCRVYRSQYEPAWVLSRDAGGKLQGILPLAVSAKNDVVHVGAQQAEYHAWVCAPEIGDDFIADALRAVGKKFGGATLEFNFLPPNAPLAWRDRADIGGRTLLTAHQRPLLRLGDGSEIEQSLRKSSNKSRLRKLKKIGPMEFRRLTTRAELEPYIDEIIHCYDMRHLAMRGAAPFEEDELKREFHLAMLDGASADLLHVTVLTFGDVLATAHLGVCGQREVELGLMTYNPLLSDLSPGKFHIYFLGQMMLREGRELLDLTCGGEFYKDRFANGFDEVHTLRVFPSAGTRRASAVRVLAKDAMKRALLRWRISPAKAIAGVRRFKRVCMGVLTAGPRASTIEPHADVAGSAPLTAGSQAESLPTRRDSLSDLLRYQPAHRAAPSRQEFLSDALRRMEAGQHALTCLENGRLHITWEEPPPPSTEASGTPKPKPAHESTPV